MLRSWLTILFVVFALPAAAQQQPMAQQPAQQPGGAGWQQGGGNTWQQGGGSSWQQIPGSQQRPPTGIMPLPNANNLAPELSDNHQRMVQQRRLNERVESGSALILQGVIPRGR
jgi:hypothetical protein